MSSILLIMVRQIFVFKPTQAISLKLSFSIQKVFTLICGQKLMSSKNLSLLFEAKTTKMNDGIVTNFLFSESANWETVREVNLIHNPQNIARCTLRRSSFRLRSTQ